MRQDSQPFQCPFNSTEIRVDIVVGPQDTGCGSIPVSIFVQIDNDRFKVTGDGARSSRFPGFLLIYGRLDIFVVFHQITRGKIVSKTLLFSNKIPDFGFFTARACRTRLYAPHQQFFGI